MKIQISKFWTAYLDVQIIPYPYSLSFDQIFDFRPQIWIKQSIFNLPKFPDPFPLLPRHLPQKKVEQLGDAPGIE